jgi:hypothetical protein
MYVRRSTAAQYAATKVTTKYPIQRSERVYWVFDGSRASIRASDCCNSVTFAGPQLSVNETVYPKERSFSVFRG